MAISFLQVRNHLIWNRYFKEPIFCLPLTELWIIMIMMDISLIRHSLFLSVQTNITFWTFPSSPFWRQWQCSFSFWIRMALSKCMVVISGGQYKSNLPQATTQNAKPKWSLMGSGRLRELRDFSHAPMSMQWFMWKVSFEKKWGISVSCTTQEYGNITAAPYYLLHYLSTGRL